MIRFHSNEKRDLSRIHYARAGSYYYLTEDYFKRILKLTSIFSGDMTMITDMRILMKRNMSIPMITGTDIITMPPWRRSTR